VGASGQVDPYPDLSTPVFCAEAPQTESELRDGIHSFTYPFHIFNFPEVHILARYMNSLTTAIYPRILSCRLLLAIQRKLKTGLTNRIYDYIYSTLFSS
jgi:hypothetical protein